MATRTLTRRAALTAGREARAGGLAAAVAAAADLLIYVVARATGVGLEIPLQPGSARQLLPAGMVVAAVMAGAAAATIVHGALGRFLPRAGVFPVVGIAVLVLSLGAPLTVAGTDAATKVTLVLMHLVTGATIIGLLGRVNRVSTEGPS